MSQLHDDSIMPHIGGVKREFASLDVAIVPNRAPTRGQSTARVFV
jgi:hypothetical protein